MTNKKDIRRRQRFSNYKKALLKLTSAVDRYKEEGISDLEIEGMIQRFEYTFELAWNTIKDFYEEQGETEIQGSKDAVRLAFKRGLVTEGEVWMKMIQSRTLTSHTYNEDTAHEIAGIIAGTYFIVLSDLSNRLEKE